MMPSNEYFMDGYKEHGEYPGYYHYSQIEDMINRVKEFAEKDKEQECIVFAEWIRKNAVDGLDGTWEYFTENDFTSLSLNSKELYQLYLQSKTKTP